MPDIQPPFRLTAAEYRAFISVRAKSAGKRIARTKPKARQDPQQALTAALRSRMGQDAVQSEVSGIVPGRKFRADIMIPSARLIIEFDGFQYHRSKVAFQKDRERQNLLVEHGWRVLRFFNAQVRGNINEVVEHVMRVACQETHKRGNHLENQLERASAALSHIPMLNR